MGEGRGGYEVEEEEGVQEKGKGSGGSQKKATIGKGEGRTGEKKRKGGYPYPP